MSGAVILAARRSAVAPRGGALAALELHELAAPVIRAVLSDAGATAGDVGELILGNALGAGGNPARVAALAAGLPQHVAGLSIDRQCASGLDALRLGAAMIDAGHCELVIAGGVESYSRRPLRMRTFADGRAPLAYDQPAFAPSPAQDPDMTQAADALAAQMGIDRAAQDAWAVQSHAKALAARQDLRREIVTIAGCAQDTFTRALSPALAARAKVLSGSITAANTAVAADGAAVCLLASPAMAERLGGGGARILGAATLGGAPELPGIAPVAAIHAALRHSGLSPAELTHIEMMEAYSAQALASIRAAGLDPARVNLSGGALARGHPIGASGAVLAVRLWHELRGGGTGLAAIAAAGGIGSALVMQG